MEIVTKSAKATFEFGKKLADNLSFGKLSSRKATVIALYGELGSGKTTFVQGLAAGLGIKKRIVSPTFIFIRPYTLAPSRISPKGASSAYTLYHIDLYRIEKPEDARGLGLEEIFSDPTNIIAIEWAEKVSDLLPKKRIDINFEYLGENERKITTSY